MDCTICYGQPRDQTTHVHQMAMATVCYQPLNFLYWYDVPSKYSNTANWPGLPWFDAIPTTWDESHTLDGSIGRFIAVARRQGGSGNWTATVCADGTPGTSAHQTPVVVSTRTVTSATVLSVAMAPSGGQAVVLTPGAGGSVARGK